jgi:acyl-CoA thioesterase FadM
MKQPSDEQMKAALIQAEQLRAAGQDVNSLGHAFLYLHHRCQYLEKVREAADLYIRFGQAEAEHTRLLKALDLVRLEEAREREGEEGDLGLG